MKKIIKIILISTFFLLVSCNGVKRENPPNDDVINNKAYIELVSYNYEYNVPEIISIKAKTNFPENTKIRANLLGYVTSTKNNNIIDTYGDTIVINGKINISLKPWNIPQKIKFVISEENQPDEVKEIFGEQGENILIDEINKHSISPAIALFIEEFDINEDLISKLKNEKSPSFKFMKPSDFKHTAEKTLANFINCFKNKGWKSMVKYTQRSQKETSQSLSNMFSSVKSVKGFEIIERVDKNINFQIIKYRLFVETGISHRGIQQKIITANLIRENGIWGVNTTSAMGGLYK